MNESQRVQQEDYNQFVAEMQTPRLMTVIPHDFHYEIGEEIEYGGTMWAVLWHGWDHETGMNCYLLQKGELKALIPASCVEAWCSCEKSLHKWWREHVQEVEDV